MYRRVWQFVDQTWPDVVQALFSRGERETSTTPTSTTTTLLHLYESDQLQYASREPAVNVYRDGGAFAAHEDNETLTALVVLSDPDHDFEGGGTAFYASRQHQHHGKDSTTTTEPRFVLRPPAGSVLLFGGTVTHAACPVTKGCRVMAVASFSRQEEEQDDNKAMAW